MGIRVISGIIGILITFFVIMYGGFLFMVCAASLAVIAWQEYVRAFANKDLKLPLWLGMGAVAVLSLSGVATGSYTGLFMPVVSLILAVFLIRMVFCHRSFSPVAASLAIMGVFYIGGGFYYIMQLRLLPADKIVEPYGMTLGCLLLWMALIGTWASDTFAYFTGFFLGKHKLCPSVSPKKTIEGFIGGVVGSIAALTALGWYFNFALPAMALLGAMIAVIATLGDLVESVIKRYTGIKDSGNLIPGHGGVLDRFDSLLFTAPLVYYFYIFGQVWLMP